MKLALCGYYGYDEMNGSDSRENRIEVQTRNSKYVFVGV